MPELKRLSLVKPSVHTKFHIDFDWWSQNDNDWHVYLLNLLCPQHQQVFADSSSGSSVDWIDPNTAEIQQVDGVQHTLISHCAKEPGFINEHTTLVDAVFRLFLANGNAPLTAGELSERLNKSPDKILQTFSAGRVYRGIRPFLET